MLARTRPIAYVDPFARMTRDIDRLFDTLAPMVRPTMNGESALFMPPMNVWEDENAFHVETEVPGVPMENVEVLASPDSITIKGRREHSMPENSESHVRERHFGSFERTMSLANEINVDAVEARLENGVLHLTLPKAENGHRQRKIKISSTGAEQGGQSAS